MSNIHTIEEFKSNTDVSNSAHIPILKLRGHHLKLLSKDEIEKEVKQTQEFISQHKSQFNNRRGFVQCLNDALKNGDHEWHKYAVCIMRSVKNIKDYNIDLHSESNKILVNELLNEKAILEFTLMSYEEIIAKLCDDMKELQINYDTLESEHNNLINSIEKENAALAEKYKNNLIKRQKAIDESKTMKIGLVNKKITTQKLNDLLKSVSKMK